MKTLIISYLLLLALPAWADSEKIKQPINLAPPGMETNTRQDPGSATPLLYADPAKLNSTTKEGFSSTKNSVRPTCIDNLGMTHSKGDTGYDTCVNNTDISQPRVPYDSRHNPPSVGISIGH